MKFEKLDPRCEQTSDTFDYILNVNIYILHRVIK